MVELFANNAHGTIAAGGLTNVATTLNLNAGQGALFPSPTSGDFFRLDIENVGLTSFETVYCTARSGDALTIQRGKDGTVGTAFAANDRCRLRPTAAMLDAIPGVVEAEGYGLMTAFCGMGASFGSDWGALATNTGGTASNSSVANTNQQTSIPGIVFTATTAIQILGIGWGITQQRIWRGNAANRGGFEVWQAFAIPADVSGCYGFWGMDESTSATYSGGSPEGRGTTEHVGVGFASSSSPGGNFFVYHSNGGGVVTAINTGIPRTATGVFLVRFYAPANGSFIQVTLYDIATGVSFTTTITTNLPDGATFLVVRFTMSGAIGGATKVIAGWRFNVNQSEPTA